jgi:non-ribosomal peptide synthetase component F
MISDPGLDLTLDAGVDALALAHSERFRKVSNHYPRRVAEVYGGDLSQAMADSDKQVAGTVAAWERSHGLEPRDWVAIGIEERGEAYGEP